MNEGIKEIVETLVIAIVLVVAVVYLFLQGWRATLIPLLAVPVSLVGTFMFFPLFGFSINTLSLFGLVLAIGLVVDDAIVVVEAVERHIEDGLAPKASGAESDGGDLGPGDRHRAGAFRGVHADGVHPRHHGQALPAVRGNHRDLGDPLGVQRALAQPRAGGAASEAEEWRAGGCWRDSSAGSTACSAAPPTAMFACPARCFARARSRCFCWPDSAWRDFGSAAKLPTSFVPDEDQGYFYLNIQLPNAASLQRTEEVVAKIEKIAVGDPGR